MENPVLKSKFDSIYIGLAVGLLIPFVTVVVFYYTSFTSVPFYYFLNYSKQINILPQLFSLGALPNLGIFFTFLWKRHYYSARGVILATLVLAFLVLLAKLFL